MRVRFFAGFKLEIGRSSITSLGNRSFCDTLQEIPLSTVAAPAASRSFFVFPMSWLFIPGVGVISRLPFSDGESQTDRDATKGVKTRPTPPGRKKSKMS